MSEAGGAAASAAPDLLIPALTVGALVAVAAWEAARRRRKRKFPATKRRASNLSFWVFNTTAAAALFVPPDQLRAPWPLPNWLGLIAGFLALDAAIYGMHRLYHALPALWRLHALHHSDPDVDVTTSVRHHPAEYLSAGSVYWTAIVAIGIPGPAVVLHGLCTFVLAAVTHADVRWPAWIERALAPVIITLGAHRVHHSIDPGHANKNFGAVLSIFDRLLGTYREPVPVQEFGVEGLDPRDACSPTQMLLTPLKVGSMYTSTIPINDGRSIEVSAERRGRTLRLRARLVKDGFIKIAHLADYRGAEIEFAVESFTYEFEGLAGLEGLRLFPDHKREATR